MRTEKRTILFWSGVACASAAALLGSAACSSDDGGDPLLNPQGPSGTGGSPSTNGGGQPALGGNLSATAGSPSINITAGTSSTPPMGGGFAECATKTSNAELKPVNMFIQFDRSSSMLDNAKWEQATKALNAFFQDPASDGLKVALRFFPDENPLPGCSGVFGGGGGFPPPPQQGGAMQGGAMQGGAMQGGTMQAPTCDAVACGTPLVNLGTLIADPSPADAHEAALLTAITNATPADPMAGGGGGTPIHPALQGALNWAATKQLELPAESFVVVLVTDGTPTVCNQNIQQIAGLAATALMQNQVKTYAIGIEGSSEQQMNQIARAGGTERAYFSGNAATAQQDLIAALNAIRGNVLTCDFAMPEGDNLDPKKINIQFTGADGVPQTLAQTASIAECASGGWYYDNPAAPSRISLCESTCQQVQGNKQAKLDVVVGCQTQVR